MNRLWLSMKVLAAGLNFPCNCPSSSSRPDTAQRLPSAECRREEGEEEDNPLSDLPDELYCIISTLARANADERGRGTGALNVFRLVSKAHKRAAEGYATSLTYREYHGVDVLPMRLINRCIQLQKLTTWSDLKSLDGLTFCQTGIRRIFISQGGSIQDLAPLSQLKSLEILRISPAINVTCLDPLASCTSLSKLHLPKLADRDDSFGTVIDILALGCLRGLEVFECGPMTRASPLFQIANS